MRSTTVFLCLFLLVGAGGMASPGWISPLSDGAEVDLPESFDASVPTPKDFLGYALGERFTHHERILDYLQEVSRISPKVRMTEYGRTYEERPLQLVTISSAANLERLESILAEHRRIANAELNSSQRAAALRKLPVIVWLAYGVHGNESSSAEVAMAATYVFAAAKEWESRLESTILVIDPLVNPDGRERYVHDFEQRRGRRANANPSAAEHSESWPGGRQNHYLIDLNRDWAWASQRETQARLVAYRRWEPHVYVDYHEMFHESSYFFPPPAAPVHRLIDERTVSWLETFGLANANAFDDQGWPFYTSESFDLFYPGYGDSYPGFRGAVGMTYEMAGHGRAGSEIERENGTTLTLADRIAHHLTTSIATARTAFEHRPELLRDFAEVRATAAAGPGSAFLWSGKAPEGEALADLLELHGIRVSALPKDLYLTVRPLLGKGNTAETRFAAGTYVVDTAQPLGNLARALLELDPQMNSAFVAEQRQREESWLSTEFYDITAWSIPSAFNLEAWASETVPGGLVPRSALEPRIAEAGRVGFIVPPAGIAGYRFAAALSEAGIRFRLLLDEVSIQGNIVRAGSLFIPRRENDADYGKTVASLAREIGIEALGVDSSWTDSGPSLGSDRVPSISTAHVALLGGPGISATSFGFLWHLLDQQVGASVTRINTDSLWQVDLSRFDVFIVPDTWGLGRSADEDFTTRLTAWIEQGGILVGVGSAYDWLKAKELTPFETWSPDSADSDPTDTSEDSDADAGETSLAQRPLSSAGSILASSLATKHPLTVGLSSAPPVLFGGSTILLPAGNPRQDVLLVAKSSPLISGTLWPEMEERLAGSLLVGVSSRGRGQVIVLSQDPDFRLFWRGTAPIFLNAVLYGPSLRRQGAL